MGLFDFLTGGGSKGGGNGGGGGGWRGSLRNISSLDDAQKKQVFEAWMTEVGGHLGGGQVRYNSNDEEVQWRGTVNGLPLRLKADIFPSVSGALKFDNPHGSVDLNWDPQYVEQPGDADAWDEDDTVRVFVGKGVVIETFASGIQSDLAGFKALPAEPMQHLVTAMQRDGVSHLYIRDDEIEWSHKQHADDMPDPVQPIVQFAQVAAWAAASWMKMPVDPQARALIEQAENDGVQAIPALSRTRCKYCGAAFILDTRGQCPNCGAPAH